VAKVEIERSGDQTRVIIHTARPGIIIGRKGAEVDKLKAELEKAYSGQVYITVKEIKKPELDAQLVCENVATQLEKRVAFRRAMKRSVQSALRLGAQGIKIMVGGRLGGAEIARPSIRSGQTSTMDLPKPIRRWGRSGSRPGSTKGRSFRCSPSRKSQHLTVELGN
jgi:ribosomal protein S3